MIFREFVKGNEMAKYRKKPVVIEAVQITERMRVGLESLPVGVSRNYAGGSLYVGTPEGVMSTKVDDWIITGIKGEKYPCKPDIFEKTYELVE